MRGGTRLKSSNPNTEGGEKQTQSRVLSTLYFLWSSSNVLFGVPNKMEQTDLLFFAKEKIEVLIFCSPQRPART